MSIKVNNPKFYIDGQEISGIKSVEVSFEGKFPKWDAHREVTGDFDRMTVGVPFKRFKDILVKYGECEEKIHGLHPASAIFEEFQ